MAGAFLREHVPGLLVTTSGTHVIEGMPMSWRTRDAIASLGLPIPDHRSRQATVQELDSADLVIALAREHVAWMRRVHPRAAPRTATLKRLARDLPDDGSPLVDRLAAMQLRRGRARTVGGRARSRGRRSRRVPRLRARDRRPSALRHSPAVGSRVVGRAVGRPAEPLASRRRCSPPGGAFEIVDVEVDGVTIQSFKNRIRTLRDLLLKSPDFGDKTYMLATDGVNERRISYAEHARLVASVAAAFRDRYDVQPGDRVAILGANSPEWVISFWAAISLGAIAVGLNGWSTGPEIRYFVDDCDPKVLVADRKRVERIAGDDLGVPIVVMEDDFAGARDVRPRRGLRRRRGRRGRPRDHPLHVGHDRPAQGRDQHASQRVVVPDAQLLQRRQGDDARAAARPDDPPPLPPCQLVSSPLFHVSGLHSAAVMMLATGLKSVWLMGRFDPAVAMQVIEREQCTGWSFTETRAAPHGEPPRRREVRPLERSRRSAAAVRRSRRR